MGAFSCLYCFSSKHNQWKTLLYKENRLTFNHGFALTGFRTTRPRSQMLSTFKSKSCKRSNWSRTYNSGWSPWLRFSLYMPFCMINNNHVYWSQCFSFLFLCFDLGCVSVHHEHTQKKSHLDLTTGRKPYDKSKQ